MKCHERIIVAAGLVSIAATAGAQLPESRILTLDVAQAIAEEAMAQCHARGYHVTVLVVDALNQPKYMLRDDKAPPVTAQIAKMTASSAMIYGHPSAPGPGASADGVSQSFVDGTMKAKGALPIKVGEAIIGAVAVEGAPKRDENVACATAALQKVADRLR